MELKQILACWKESIELLKWKNLRLILLASLNNFRRSLITFIKYFGWIALFLPFVKTPITTALWVLCVQFIFILSSRASIEIKNYKYFLTYSPYFWGVFLLCFIFAPIGWISSFFFVDSKNNSRNLVLAFKNGIKFTIYYLPLTTLLFMCSFLYMLILCHLAIISIPLFLLITSIFHLFFISMVGIIFIKFKHSSYNLFFGN